MDTPTALLDQAGCTPASGALRVEPVGSDELAAMCLAWNRIAGDVPFCQWEWLEAWWRHFRKPGDELFVLAVRDAQGELVGLAPWYIGRSLLFGRVVRFLGSGLVCSDYLSLFCAPGRHEEVASRVADWLHRDAAGRWHAIELSGVTDGDPAIECLAEQLGQKGHRVDRRSGLNCWRLHLPADWDVYLAELSKSRRERVRQLGRRQFETGRAVLQTVRCEADLARGLTILKDLHRRRRKAVSGRYCSDDPRMAAFMAEAAERFLRLGTLRLQWIELEGRPVAAEFDVSGGNTVFFYMAGFDPAASAERPGWLGTMAALRWAIADGYRYFDFLRGDEAYKSHWRAEACPQVELRIAARHAELRHHTWQALQSAKSCLRGGRRAFLRRFSKGHS